MTTTTMLKEFIEFRKSCIFLYTCVCTTVFNDQISAPTKFLQITAHPKNKWMNKWLANECQSCRSHRQYWVVRVVHVYKGIRNTSSLHAVVAVYILPNNLNRLFRFIIWRNSLFYDWKHDDFSAIFSHFKYFYVRELKRIFISALKIAN